MHAVCVVILDENDYQVEDAECSIEVLMESASGHFYDYYLFCWDSQRIGSPFDELGITKENPVVPTSAMVEFMQRHSYAPLAVVTSWSTYRAQVWNGFELVQTDNYFEKLIKELIEYGDGTVATVVDIHF